ncbi:glyoxalase-like domain-containing protein [Nocardia nova SH22a]|uniref:Glyoxalase-like domain-containing protein n=1 Tax=Nocardia nova SH22a TaxID=1415166 RepID=W5TI71_9NOCA|nr:VOC family protein [Nocardia nova]AHH16911.1 glyoxalase-like domain-containing protein [Nocardia nova SH22a]
MKIFEIALTATSLDSSAEFYRDLLGLAVSEKDGGIVVEVGSSRLVVSEGVAFEGVHHLAFGISPHDFDPAYRWLGQRTPLVSLEGVDFFDGPAGWDSRSVYFRGPDGILLELIARQADRAEPATDGEAPRLLSISEVGIAVPDVGAAVRDLAASFGLPAFTPQLPGFTPVGGHDGLLILVDADRTWFPTERDMPAGGPVTVDIDAAVPGGPVELRAGAVVQAR